MGTPLLGVRRQSESEFGQELDALRAQAGVNAMTAHVAVRSAAAELAGQVLESALIQTHNRRSNSMASRIRRAGYRLREALVEFWFTDAASQEVLLRKLFSEFGLAADVAETDDGPTVVWVLSLARPGRV